MVPPGCDSHRRATLIVVRPRSPAAAVTAAIAVLTGAAILAGCGSDDDGGDTQRFCAEVAANTEAIVRAAARHRGRRRRDARPLPRPGGRGADRDRGGMARPAGQRRDGEHRGPRRSRIGPADRRRRLRHRESPPWRSGTGCSPTAASTSGRWPRSRRRIPAATTTLPLEVSTSIITVVPPATTLAPESSRPRHAPTAVPAPVPPRPTAAAGDRCRRLISRRFDQTISPRRRITLSTRP